MFQLNKLFNIQKGGKENAAANEYQLREKSGHIMYTFINVAVGTVSLVVSMLIGMYLLGSGSESVFLGVFSVLLLLVAIGFFTLEIFLRVKRERSAALTPDSLDQEYFENSEVIPVFSTKRMFYSESEKTHLQTQIGSTPVDDDSNFEKETMFEDAVAKFVRFAMEHGCQMDTGNAKKLFASLASSRILIAKQMASDEFALLTRVLSGFFGANTEVDLVDGNTTNGGNLLFDANNEKKNALKVIESAQQASDKVHFIALDDLTKSHITNCFASLIAYAKVPEATHFITVSAADTRQKYYLPQNLWVLVNLAEGENIPAFPTSLLEVSTLLDISFAGTEPAENMTAMLPITYSQFKLMIEKSNCEVTEEEWKKLDAFVAYLNEGTPFEISNKQWIGIEKYISVLCECGESIATAFDLAMAARMIPSALSCAAKADKKIDVLAGLSASFKEGELSIARKAVKSLSKSAPRK